MKGSSTSGGMERMGGEFVEGGAYLSWHHLNYSVFARDGREEEGAAAPARHLGIREAGNDAGAHGFVGGRKVDAHGRAGAAQDRRKITGEVLVNGRKTDANLSRIIGYVEQQDIHAPTQTIYEAIELSALVPTPPPPPLPLILSAN